MLVLPHAPCGVQSTLERQSEPQRCPGPHKAVRAMSQAGKGALGSELGLDFVEASRGPSGRRKGVHISVSGVCSDLRCDEIWGGVWSV